MVEGEEMRLTEYTQQVLKWGGHITVKIANQWGFNRVQKEQLIAAGARFDWSRGWVIDMSREDAKQKCEALKGFSMEYFYKQTKH